MLKEGVVEDYENQARIAKLLRFKTTTDESADPGVSLDTYIERMAEGQEKIYYITADTLAEAKHSPHLEIFKKKDIEVLLLTDRVDEWVMAHMTEYEGKEFASVAKGALDLGEAESEEEKEQQKKLEEESKDLVERINEKFRDPYQWDKFRVPFQIGQFRESGGKTRLEVYYGLSHQRLAIDKKGSGYVEFPSLKQGLFFFDALWDTVYSEVVDIRRLPRVHLNKRDYALGSDRLSMIPDVYSVVLEAEDEESRRGQ